jgi:cyclopropane-fatty-acyl-phospholipid synthase
MEMTKSLPKATQSSLSRKLVFNQLKDMTLGKANITLPEGETFAIGNGDGVICNIHIKSDDFFKKVIFGGDIGFGESYVDGDWETDSITNVIKWAITNVENTPTMSGSSKKWSPVKLLGLLDRVFHISRRNNKENSVKNIAYHYDLSNEFYKLWLDPTMTYSCGIFNDENTTLEQSQYNKYQSLADQLQINEDDHVLEIGSGWGGFCTFIAEKYGCKVTTVTISQEQYKYAKELIEKKNLGHLIDLRFEDYRNIEGRFTKIASIEMLEAVGHEYLPEYFKKCQDLLAKNGLLGFQVIMSPDARYDEFRKGVDWIQKHIFPGSLLPSVSAINNAINKTGDMHLVRFKEMGLHYAKTLSEWWKRFEDQKEEVTKLGLDEHFIRKWRYYLNYCEAAFYERNITVAQLVYSRPNNSDLN